MECEYRYRIVLLDFGHPMNIVTIKNITNSLENILALSLTFLKNKNGINFGILSLDSEFKIFQSELNLRRNYDLIIRNLRALSERSNRKVTVQEYKFLLRNSIETVLCEFQEKEIENYSSKSKNLLIQFAIITKKSASVLDDIIMNLTNRLQKNISSTSSMISFKIVQILSESEEKTCTTSEKSTLIDWVFCVDNINNFNCFFKDWLLNSHRKLRILFSTDPNLEINCDVSDCILNSTSFTFDKKFDLFNEIPYTDSNFSSGISKQIYNLEITHRLSVKSFCPTLVFGIPRRIYATSSSSFSETELQKNLKIFKELCRELQRTGQGLLTKSLIPTESNELISFHFLTSDGEMLLMNNVAPDELYLPKRSKLPRFSGFSEDKKAVSAIKTCFQKVKFLEEYASENFSSGIHEYSKNYLIQMEQSKCIFRQFDPNVKLRGKKTRKENLNMFPDATVYTKKTERLTGNACEKRKKKPKLNSEKELQNVHPALLSPNIVKKYRKINSHAFVIPELGKEYNSNLI